MLTPLLLPVTFGFEDTTLIRYELPELVAIGMIHVMLPEFTEVTEPKTVDVVNEPN